MTTDIRALHRTFVAQWPRLSKTRSKLQDLTTSVEQHYRRWLPPQHRSDELVMYPPGLLREPSITAANRYTRMVDRVLQLSLYTDKLYVPDLLELFARRSRRSTQPGRQPRVRNTERVHVVIHYTHGLNASDQEHGDACRTALIAFQRLEPLIDAGIVVLYPPVSLFERFIERPLFGGGDAVPEKDIAYGWPELFVREGTMFSLVFNASYVALGSQEYQALRIMYQRGLSELGASDIRVVTSLARMRLPFLSDGDGSKIVQARSDGSAFDDFRRMLREYTRSIPGDVRDAQFGRDVQEVAESMIRDFQQLAQPGMRKSTRESVVELGIGAAIGYLAGGWMKVLPDVVKTMGKLGLKLRDREEARPAVRLICQLLAK